MAISQITSNSIAAGAVSASDLADASITPAKLSTGAPYWDSSGNVGIGTTSPTFPLDVAGAIRSNSWIGRTNVSTPSGDAAIYRAADNTLGFSTASTERMRIDSSGYVLVGTTTNNRLAATNTQGLRLTGSSGDFLIEACSTQTPVEFGLKGTTGNVVNFFKDGNNTGGISVTNTTTSYNTSSDYRLKENIAPMTGALATVSALKPVTYTWKSTGEESQGFIAHELQAVVPDCVTGEKDAVDADGNPVYQAIDTSFLVATLTAAIQELKAEFDEYKRTHP